MLTLLPLSGFQDAFKRRNSKTMDQFGDRRGSISVYDNYSLPSSKSSMRRFSSYEELAPFFQQILAQEKPLPAAASPLVKSRRGSVTAAIKGSFKRRKSVTASTIADSAAEASCDDLDAKLARIRNQLAQLKSEDIDMSQRVDDLSSSVESLYSQNMSPQDQLFFSLRQEKMERSHSMQYQRSSLSTPGLESISESGSEDEEEGDEQAFEDYCKRSIPLMSRSRPTSHVSEEPSATEDKPVIDTKEYCLLNNTVRPKAKSTSQLNVIRNDLTRHDREYTSSKRLSVISCVSDSVLITHKHLPEFHPLKQ